MESGAAVVAWRTLRAEGWRAVVDRARDRWRESQWRVTFPPAEPGDETRSPVLNVLGVPAAARFGAVPQLVMARLRVEARERAVALLSPYRRDWRLDWWTSEARFGRQFPRRGQAADPLAPDPHWLEAVRRAIALTTPRFVHVESVAGLAWPTVLELARSGVPLVLSVPDVGGFGQAAHRALAAELLERAVAVIAPSEYAREVLRRRFPETPAGRWVVIPPGIAEPAIAETSSRDPHQVAMVIGAAPADGALAVEVAEAIAARGIDVTVYDGDGRDHLPALRQLAGVTVRGYCAAGTMSAEIVGQSAAASIVLSSEPEPFSLVLSESWAAGVPVVAPATGVFPERLAAGGGILVAPDASAEAIADAVDALRISPLRVPAPQTAAPAAAAHVALYLACA